MIDNGSKTFDISPEAFGYPQGLSIWNWAHVWITLIEATKVQCITYFLLPPTDVADSAFVAMPETIILPVKQGVYTKASLCSCFVDLICVRVKTPALWVGERVEARTKKFRGYMFTNIEVSHHKYARSPL